jgi:hypothetical protein
MLRMKRFWNTLVIVFVALVLVTSCKKDDGDTPVDPKAENRKSLGISAEDLLSEDIYDQLTIELVYPPSFRPTDIAINEFRSFLNERLNKSGGINIVETVIEAPSGAPFSIEEIRAIEEEHREHYTMDNNIAVYIFFSNGVSTNDTNTSVTLGTAYRNTSIVVYERTVRNLASNNPNIELHELEINTLEHEFGHILGLVNIQGDDIHNDHEDPAHSKHCVVEDCLMYFESTDGQRIVERISKKGMLPTFDPLCIADLQAKGGK